MISKNENISINVQYKIYGNDTWIDYEISPEEYFDLDEGGKIEIDSVPIYNHAIDYLKDLAYRIVATRVIIKDKDEKAKRSITTVYWNEQKNCIIERVDSNKGVNESELIIESRIQDFPSIYEIMRIVRDQESLTPIYHGFIADKEDGSQEEIKIV